jgi:hypothetical protein
LKQKAIKGLVDKAAAISGGINFDDAFQSLVVNYYEEKGYVIVSIPFYVPSMARFILKRKLTKAFQEIFNKSCKKKVKVDFVDWGV